MGKFSSDKIYSDNINKKYFFIFLILLCIIPISKAQSEDKPKILFLDGDKTLVFQVDQLDTVNISIINEKNVSENVSVWISDLSTDAGNHILSSDILMPYTKNIPPASVGVFHMTFKKDLIVSPGTYSGKVTATSSNADTISKDITIIIPSNISKFTVLTKDITINGTSRKLTWPCCTTFTEKNVYFVSNGSANLSSLNLSGVITNGGGKEGKIILQTEKAVSYDGYIAVPLKVEGIDSPGKYSGTVYLDPSDQKNSEKINIVVTVNDSIIWPFLVVLLGVVTSIGLTYWWNDWRLRTKIRDQIWLLNKEAVMQHRSFGQEHEYMPYCHYSTHHSIQLKLGELERDLRRVDPGQLDAIRIEVDKIDNYLDKFTPFLIRAEKLFNKFIFYDSVLAERCERVDPIFFQDTRSLLVGQQISIFNETESKSEIAELEKKLQESELFLDSFYRMYDKLSNSEQIIDFIALDISKYKLDKKEKSIFDDLKKEIEKKKYSESLKKIRETLWKAGTLQSLVEGKIEESLNDIAIYALNFRQEKLSVLFLRNCFKLRELEKSLDCIPDISEGFVIRQRISEIKSRDLKDENIENEIKGLNDQLSNIRQTLKQSKIELFWNHQNIEKKHTPETYNWLRRYKPELVSPERIDNIKKYIKNKKIEYRPKNVLRGIDVEIWSDMGFIPNLEDRDEKRQLLPFEWVYYKLEEKVSMSAKEWDDIQGNDNSKLIKFLKQKFDVEWEETEIAKIEKINDNAKKVSNEKNYILLTKVPKIDEVRSDKFDVKIKNGKLNKVPGWDWVVPSTQFMFKEKGNYCIELKIGQESLISKIEVKGNFGWVRGIISSSMSGLYNMFCHVIRHIYDFPNRFPTFLASSMVAVATILIASIFGITLLYSNQGFGSLKDYLAAFVWGSTADQATKLITPLLGKITK